MSVLSLDWGIPSSFKIRENFTKLLNHQCDACHQANSLVANSLVEYRGGLGPHSWALSTFHDAMEEGLVVKLRSAQPCNKPFLMVELNYWRKLAYGELLTIALMLNYLSCCICYWWCSGTVDRWIGVVIPRQTWYYYWWVCIVLVYSSRKWWQLHTSGMPVPDCL